MGPVFDTDFEPHYGELVAVSPLLRRIVCENPSKYTFHGTGTYVIGRGQVAVVDPGPRSDAHVADLLRVLDGETVTHILVTHTHGDHSPAAVALADATGAPVLGFGPHPPAAQSEGDDDEDEDEGVEGDAAGPDDPPRTEEQIRQAAEEAERHRADVDFAPTDRLGHGDVVRGPGWTVQALHTPGHISNHLCFALQEEQAVLTGDHVMGWSTTIIPPPDGDIAAYLRSLDVLLERDDQVLYPTHGAPINDPMPYVRALHAHRLDREQQILSQLLSGPRSATELVAELYADVRAELHRPAARSVIAHLLKLQADGRAVPAIADAHLTSPRTTWALT